jgi:hypothetical protein
MRDALILGIGLSALIVGAPARAGGVASCANIEEPLAYNACLARFGPHAPTMHGATAPDGEEDPPPAGERKGGEFSQGGHGRPRAEFDVGGRRRRP